MDWVSFEKNILKKIYTGAVQERVKFLHMHISVYGLCAHVGPISIKALSTIGNSNFNFLWHILILLHF